MQGPAFLSPAPYFDALRLYGRGGLLENLHFRLSRKPGLLLLGGEAGVGKTALAAAYVHEPSYASHYRNVAWVTASHDVRAALTAALGGEAGGSSFVATMDRLRALPGPNLLVIDNVDEAAEILRLRPALESLGWHVLVTTRAKAPTLPILRAERLDEKAARRLFYAHYGKERNDKALGRLLARAGSHPLLTELFAKTANANPHLGLTALDELLEERNPSPLQPPTGREAPEALRDGIATVLGASRLTEDERKALSAMSALAPKPIAFDELADWLAFSAASTRPSRWQTYWQAFKWSLFGKKPLALGKSSRMDAYSLSEALDGLARKGWVSRSGDSYRMHPLVQSAARNRLRPTVDSCLPLIDAFVAELYIQPGESPLEKSRYVGHAEALLACLREDHLRLSLLADNLATIYKSLGEYPSALRHGKRATAINEKLLPFNSPVLAASYNNLGVTYGETGDLRKSLYYHNRALAIRETVLDKKSVSLAVSYNNIAVVYRQLGDLEKDAEYKMKAVQIFEEALGGDDPNLATAYDNLGVTFSRLEMYDLSLEYKNKALSIRERALSADHPELALAYSNVAIAHYHLRDLARATAYIDRSVSIRERILPQAHPELLEARQTQRIIRRAVAS